MCSRAGRGVPVEGRHWLSSTPLCWHGKGGVGGEGLRWYLACPPVACGAAAPAPSCSLRRSVADELDPPRSAGYGVGVMPETVSKLCEEGRLKEAVEALGVLVQIGWHISKSLLYTVLRGCVVQKDLLLGRRVHAFTVQKGYQSDTFLGNHLLRLYASHGRLQDAMDVFTVVASPDAFMWSSIISAHVKRGLHKQAVELYRRMRRSGVEPDSHVFVAALQACAKGEDLKAVQELHADVLASGFERDLFVCNCLVDVYGKCDSLGDARRVFDGLVEKDVVTWTTMISGYSQQGMGQEALLLYSVMLAGGMAVPSSVTYVCLLQACASVGSPALEKGKQLHEQIRAQGHMADVSVANSLVNMYAKCGSLEDAHRLFCGLGQKDVVTWTALIAGYSQQGRGQEALQLYSAMQEEGIAVPNSVTFVCLLQACASVGTPVLEKGRELHAQVREGGHLADVSVANSLISMYARCGNLEDARGVFDGLLHKNVVTWSAMIAAYSQQCMGEEALGLYRAMQEEGIVTPNSVTFVSLLQACASLGTSARGTGEQVHAEIRERGLQGDSFVANSLVNMYAKCGSLKDAQRVFDELGKKDVMIWTTLLAGYSQQGMGQEALSLYGAMQEEGIVAPDAVTFVCLLQACASVGSPALETGKQLHVQIRQQGYQADVFVANSLVNMYAKCGSLEDAQGVFDGLGHKDVVTWTSLISGYAQQGMGKEALQLYGAMEDEGIAVPNSVTLMCLLQACACVGASALEMGKQLHTQIREQGYEADVSVANSLVNMYSKCGSLDDARRVFGGLDRKDVVTWTALIAGYSQQGLGLEALRLYSAMQEDGVAVPDSVTFVCLLQACANVAALHLGRQLHVQIKQQGLEPDVFVAGSLINMYAKSGSMAEARQVFDSLSERNVVAWNGLIAGYSHQGDNEEVFDLLRRMREDDIQPDGITFLGVLTVCGHTGLVSEGWEYFESMCSHSGIAPTVEHYACMVGLLGRAGRLDEAQDLVRSMHVPPDSTVWHTLLGACQKWSNVEVGRHAFDQAVKLDKKDAAAYVLMSNIYTRARMWEQAQAMQRRRVKIRAWKQPGQSWWTDIDGLVHSFLVGDIIKQV